MSEFDREASAGRFAGIGMRTSEAADAMPANRCPYCQNIRQYSNDHIRSRPQMQQYILPPSSPGPVLSIEADLGYYNVGNTLYLGGISKYTLLSGYGASLLPFRPNASPQAWEYVYDANTMVKTTPGISGVQLQGIMEFSAAVDAAVTNWQANWILPSSTWASSGVAGAVTAGTRTTETVLAVFNDPAISTGPITLQVGGTQKYQREMLLLINGGPTGTYVRDVFQPIPSVTISSVTYFAGTTGHCIVVPKIINPYHASRSLFMEQWLATLRRGALVQIDSEVCYVWNVTIGPNDQICFETSTVSTHGAGATLTGVSSIQVANVAIAAGNTIASQQWSFAVSGAGTGSISTNLAGSPFSYNNASFQENDFVHLSIECSSLENLNEIKIVFDVNNGAADFVTNSYFATIRPNDIQAGIANTLTQLGVAQIVAQRALIDEEAAVEANNSGNTVSSFQTSAGDNTFSEILIPIGSLTRIGNDQSRTLNNTQAVQVLVNASGAIGTLVVSSITFRGMFTVDVGATGIPIKYRIRPRSSSTGAMGNPSPEMRYAVSARREGVQVKLPTFYSDSQIDTLDLFRQGGALDKYTYVASIPTSVAAAGFLDNYTDEALMGGLILREDLYQPFPTVDYPYTGSAVIQGTYCTVTTSGTNPDANVERYLPGNIISIGQQEYTLRTRPTFISAGVFYFELVENASSYSGKLYIYEPLMAAQPLPYAWGPDANGRIFAVGDSYRPGFVYRTNPNDPDSSGDNANELCAPTEPLQNGALLGGTSVVASAAHWWRGYPQDNGDYNWTEIPVGVGLEFPWAICSDGEAVYFVGKDGIYAHGGGPAVSLTDDDLYNLFPHEDVYPQSITYGGQTITPPGYQYGSTFRLAMVSGYLFFDYTDINNARQTLVWNKRTKGWYRDVYANPVTVRGLITSPPGTTGGQPNQQMLCGTATGAVDTEVSIPTAGSGESVTWMIATNEQVMGDLRAPKLFGDASLDILPSGTGITATPTLLGSLYAIPTAIAQSASRTNPPLAVNLSGGILSQSMGLLVSGTDQGQVSRLYSWQPSYIIKPVWQNVRYQDWDDAGVDGNKFFQGFILEGNTNNFLKNLVIRDAETLATHPFTGKDGTGVVKFNGQSTQAFSFINPFRAHLVRFETTDTVSWQVFGIRWVFEPTPEYAEYWTTQETGFGIDGFKHLQRTLFAYSATSAVTLSITVDGRSYNFTLPATGGVYQKTEIILSSLLKGMVYTLSATSSAPFAVWSDDIEILVKQWGSADGYQRLRVLGSKQGMEAKV